VCTNDFKDAHKLWLKAAKGNQQRAQWALGDLYFQAVVHCYNNVVHSVSLYSSFKPAKTNDVIIRYAVSCIWYATSNPVCFGLLVRSGQW
jgi:hypothetical protein